MTKKIKFQTFEEFTNEEVFLNPGMTVPGMGNIELPDNSEGPFVSQKKGSGDIPTYIASRDFKIRKKKKLKKKKSEL
jgi:hypothetical protein